MKLKGVELLYNAAAHFSSLEKYPDGLVPELLKKDKSSFDALCWALAEMARQGELYRRYIGETPKEYPTEETFAIGLRPNQITAAYELCMAEIAKGLAKPDEENEEIDLVLMEIQKKTRPTG